MIWLAAAPYGLQLAVVAALLVVDSGLLIGMLLPTGALLALLATQATDQPALLGVTIAVAAGSSVLGGCLGYWRARRTGRRSASSPHVAGGVRMLARFRTRTSRISDLVGHRLSRTPTTAAAVGQFVAGARTLTPRLAAEAGVPLTRVLAGTVPAALLWVSGLVTGGALLSTAADIIGSVFAVIGPMLLGPPMLLLGLLPLYLTYRVNRTSKPALEWAAVSGRAG